MDHGTGNGNTIWCMDTITILYLHCCVLLLAGPLPAHTYTDYPTGESIAIGIAYTGITVPLYVVRTMRNIRGNPSVIPWGMVIASNTTNSPPLPRVATAGP